MGTWSLPFKNAKTATRFKKLMDKPWTAKTYFDPELGHYTWDSKHVADLCGSDDLYDRLDAKARKSKGRPFDIRPLVKRHVRAMLKAMEKDFDRGPDTGALNAVRKAVGLKTLIDKPAYAGSQKTVGGILALLAKSRITWVQTMFDKNTRQRPAKGKTSAKSLPLVYKIYLDRKSSKINLRVIKKALAPIELKSIKKMFGHILVIELTPSANRVKRKA